MVNAYGIIRPAKLRKGDVIGVVAPASPQRDDTRLKNGIRYFESCGYRVECGASLWKRQGYLAGTDGERLQDLNAMIRDPRVRMIVAGRGGYGCTRILRGLDYAGLRRQPKIIAGFSDVTALSCAVLAKSRLVSFSGAMPGVDFYEAGNIDPLAEEWFWRCVTSAKAPGLIPRPEAGHPAAATRLHPGKARGWLLAGNLTLLAALTGTPYMPRATGAVLMVEEIGEEPYRVDRLLSQLDNAGVLKKVAGLAFGAFTQAKPTRVSVDSLPMQNVFAEYVRRADVPAVGGLPYGHIKTKVTVPLGVAVRIDGSRGTLRIDEGGVE